MKIADIFTVLNNPNLTDKEKMEILAPLFEQLGRRMFQMGIKLAEAEKNANPHS